MTNAEQQQKIWQLIKQAKVGMLTTLHDGALRARPMQLVQDDYDGRLWFFTQRSAEKVIETQQDSHVCVSFADRHHDHYVSLSGRARLSNDRQRIEKYWSAFVEAWFSQGIDDPELALLEIDVEFGELWSADDNKALQLYEILKANIKKDDPDIGEHERFGRS
ncbi:pyridoxamine 5'-phosphate oxidase family protein [Idiomarina xiamenensis]|uniref:Putative general stress protein 26 n=1 Tax=Idiomarina xiamenensis 10-D-4 TaxID=740709 RepID=K2K5L4_9GAMM|nr:pyridoxamine 5'-phosphate oxidase family protein [Idiomarina xiamenensis]EKE82888.1 putative general stress protein 26 [Idiomarina xiamenensis 10-D-4]